MTSATETLVASDKLVMRARTRRTLFVIAVICAAIFIPVLVGSAIAAKINSDVASTALILFGACSGVSVVFWILPNLHFRVSGNKYLLATGFFGDVIPFGPGFFRPRFPWDKPRSDGNYTADVISIAYKETVSASDDTSLVLDGLLGYQIQPSYIDVHDGVKAADIEKFLEAKARGYITSDIPKYVAEEYRRESNEKAEEMLVSLTNEYSTTLAKLFGVVIVSNNFASVDYPPEVQEARDGAAETQRVLETVARELLGDDFVPGNGPSNFATVTKKLAAGEITKEVYNDVMRMALAQTTDATLDFKVQDFNINGLDSLDPATIAAITAGANALAKSRRNPSTKKGK